MYFKLLIFTVLVWVQQNSCADRLHIAVASNFVSTLELLAVEFKSKFGHDLVISSGSTGQLYAQIQQGAPFDVYMAADIQRPQLLHKDGLASDVLVYARGQLTVLANVADCQSILTSDDLLYLALANPQLAPYGLAAKQYLEKKQLWHQISDQVVMGENVSQVMHMVVSRNATVGLVAQSLMVNYQMKDDQCQRLIPFNEYEPIRQGMVLLNHSKKQTVYNEFKQFIKSIQAEDLLLNSGYLTDNQL